MICTISYFQTKVSLGERKYIDFSHELVINTIGDIEGHRCNPEMNRNFDKVWYEKIARENEKKFGCSVPFHPPFNTETGKKEIEICKNATIGKKAYSNFQHAIDSTFTAEYRPCAKFDIYFGLPDTDDTGNKMTEAHLALYVNTDIRVKSTVIYYDKTTFAAEIGGYVGMFLGVSMIDLAIIFNSSILAMAHKFYK